jgi:hypothetical protein
MLGMSRSMLKVMSMPNWFLGEAMITAVFILNRSPTQSIDGRTPYKVWHGENRLFTTFIHSDVLHT